MSDGFVGRERELERLHQQLQNAEWQLVHLHGMRGIGKTALLQIFAQDISDHPVFYVDGGRKGFDDIEAFLAQLHFAIFFSQDPRSALQKKPTTSQIIQQLNSIGDNANMVILIIDEFERWGNIHGWLRNRFFPSLSQRVRLFTAGQYPLDPSWTQQPGWSQIVTQIGIAPLNHMTTNNYAKNCGIENPETRAAIWEISGGVPLAVEWCCQAIRERGESALAAGVPRARIVHSLCMTLLDTDPLCSDLNKLLHVASVVWKFNQDILAEISGEEIPNPLFQQLCKLPIVYWEEENWSVQPAVRDWLRHNFSIRSPETYARFKHRAASILQRKLYSAPESLRKERLLEKLYLIDNDALHRYCFGATDETLELTRVHKSELPMLVQMRQEWELIQPPCQAEETTAHEQWIRGVWEQFPASFTAFRRHGQLVAFCSILPLCQKARNLLQSHPVYAPYIRYTEVRDPEYLLWMTAARTDGEFNPIGSVSRYLYMMLGSNHLITVITSITEEINALLSVGFSRLTWADTTSPSGLTYRALQIDLRKQGLFEIREAEQQPPLAYETSHLKKEQRLLVRTLLKRLHDLDSDEPLIAQAKRKLLVPSIRQSNASGIRRALIEAIEQLESGNESSLIIGQILRLIYIDRIGTHENIAARLGLSESTFYRYLNRGIDQLTRILLKSKP